MSETSDAGRATGDSSGSGAAAKTHGWLKYGLGSAIGVGAGGGAGVGAIFGAPGVGAAVGAAIGVVIGAGISAWGAGRKAC